MVTEPKRRVLRLKPDENTFYVARDEDRSLFQYESLPKWNGFDFESGAEGEYVQRLPEEWFPLLEPGCYTKVGPYGNVIDGRVQSGDGS